MPITSDNPAIQERIDQMGVHTAAIDRLVRDTYLLCDKAAKPPLLAALHRLTELNALWIQAMATASNSTVTITLEKRRELP